jgi:hypothetical protein
MTTKPPHRLWQWFADHAPRPLVYFCAVRLMAHATIGKHSDQVAPDLLAMDALKRWNNAEREGLKQ